MYFVFQMLMSVREQLTPVVQISCVKTQWVDSHVSVKMDSIMTLKHKLAMVSLTFVFA